MDIILKDISTLQTDEISGTERVGPHRWVTKSICRHLLYEGCDLSGILNQVTMQLGADDKLYAEHLKKRNHQNFQDHSHRANAIKILFEFYDYLSDEVTVWPMFGTLLGIVRDDDLIKHDDDIDIGYFKKDEAELIKKLDALHNTRGYQVIRNEFSNLFSLIKDDVAIDLYEYEKLNNSPFLQQGHRTFYNLMYDETFPMKTIQFRDRDLLCISDPERFFERYYGKDWKVPK
jgi:hypothetical protein